MTTKPLHVVGGEDGEPSDDVRRRAPRMGEILVEAGVIDDETIAKVLDQQRSEGSARLGTLLVDGGHCTEAEIRDALRDQMNVDVVEPEDWFESGADVANLLPVDFVRRYEVIPLKKSDDRLWLAMLDPYNLAAIDDVRFFTGITDITVVACMESDFRRYIGEHLDATSLIDEIFDGESIFDRALEYLGTDQIDLPVLEDGQEEELTNTHELQIASGESPIIAICDYMLVEGIRQNASDIHIEPQERTFRIRFRVDGRLRTLMTPPKRLEMPVVTRLKVMSELDIANRRIAQDGRMAVNFAGVKVNLRVSTLPTAYGEKCVLRVIKKDAGIEDISSLGFSEQETGLITSALDRPQGLILVTGPTGSGKTTTVLAALRHLNNGEVNIVTLEDPVEVTIAGVVHVPVRPKGGLTFSAGLRSILRQDPDIVFVGEMRDPEVTTIALRASLTGHLVLSTLHTNSAIETLARLQDMNAEPYLVAGALVLVVAQRLVRSVCTHCAELGPPNETDLRLLGLARKDLAVDEVMLAKGCARCGETGYSGRQAVFELLPVNSAVRRMVRDSARPEDILDCARESGMKTLYDSGIQLVRKRETTLAEVRRVVYPVD